MSVQEKKIEDSGKISFEAALDETGFGAYNYIHICLTGLVIISFACTTYGTTIIVPASACELDTTDAQRGALASAPVVGTVLGAVLWGYLADTRGRRSMLLVSLLGAAVVNALASFSVNWIMLLVLQFIMSLMASGKYSLSMTLLSESVPMARRNVVVLLVASISLLSQGIMAVLAIPIIPLSYSHYMPALGIYWNSWRTVMMIYCLPSLLAALWLFFMQESPKYVYSKGDNEKALEILYTIHRVNKGKSAEEFQITELEAEPSQKEEGKSSFKDQIVPMFKFPLLKYTIIMTTLSVFLQVGSFLVWLPTIANHFFQMMQSDEDRSLSLCSIVRASLESPPETEATPCALNVSALLMVLVVCVIQSVVNALISTVVSRVGRRNLVIAITAITGACGILVNVIPNAIGGAILFVAFLTGILVVGLYTAITVALFPTHLRAIAVSLTMTGGRVTGFASIQLVNYLLVNNCELGFYIFASIFASSAIVASFLPDDRHFLKPEVQDKEVEADVQNEHL